MSRTWLLGLLASSFLVASGPHAMAESPDDYGLDALSREIPAKGKVKCPKVPLVRYGGAVIRYHKPVRVYTGFKTRLQRFEETVREVAIEVYGRSPSRIRHIGTYNCRRIGGYPNLVSEHGLGNGIDIAGFDFASAKKPLPMGVAKRLSRRFKVRVKSHWRAPETGALRRDVDADTLHAVFLRRLTDRLLTREDVFRVLLGPAFPGHKDHFHFDMAPYRLVVL
ncbi:MAG: hypothetical protein ACI9MR_004511 [Myxococcota bacterium]|jgi:hypothetical protein